MKKLLLTLVAGATVLLPSFALAAKPVQSLLELRSENVVLQKWDLSCGAATLATLLTYQLHDPVTERQVAVGLLRGNNPDRVRNRGGFSLLDLKRYAETRGLEADGYEQMTLADLEEMAPVIVTFQYHQFHHFVIFRGIVGDWVVLADPAFGNRIMRVADFEKSWDGNIGFVVTRPGETPQNHMPPRASDFVGASSVVLRTSIGK
jgi:uncharacterized protein